MIQIKKKIGSVAPTVLSTIGVREAQILKRAFNAGKTKFDFKPTIYGHDLVKDALIDLQDYKCCFCEAKIGHISYGDVEHYRPKGGWVQNDEPINVPGYYWLAYDWDNLLLSCQLCNQRYKKNYFPLVNENNRAYNHKRKTVTEEPLFIHPVNDKPERHIKFKEEIPKEKTLRGKKTIEKLGLDRELLNEDRRKYLNMVRDIYELAKGYPDTYPQLKKKAKDKINKYYDASKIDETEYASMLRCFFRKNPIDF